MTRTAKRQNRRSTVGENAYAEFERLCNKRELAAYRMVGVVKTVISFFEAQNYDHALAALKDARAEYDAADRKITEFHNAHKENSTNGYRTAAV
jgi:hypothetical protein